MTQTLNKKNLHQVVDHLLEQHRGRIAIEQNGRSCSYDELDARSNSLCAALRAQGVSRGDVVALPMPASIDYVVALLAVVKCGGIFMPLDPAFPQARLRGMLDIARPRVVVGNEMDVVMRVAELGEIASVILLSADMPPPTARSQPVAGDDDTGYLIATSGSTGEPKLIAGRSKGISHFAHWEVSEFGIGSSVRASFFAPPTFDVSLREIFVPLLAGGTLVIPSPEERGDARRLVGWLREQRVTLTHCVPSLFRLLTRALAEEQEPLPDLRMIALAGEPLYGADVATWRAAAGPATQLVNLYGPSETTLAKAFHRIGDDAPPNAIVPLGQPISNTALLILRDGRLCEIGEIGELHIHTPFASNGYYGNPELTAQAFIPNPLAPDSGERIYRTGDLGRYRADRSVEFIGRADRQVKVNGVRIELPEIEGVMRGHPEVTEAVAHTFRLPDGENILVGYYTANGELDAQTLRAGMQASLPDNMLPAWLLQLPEFPRNLNGKIDRKGLPRPESLLNQAHGYTPPEGELETEIARMWAEALGLERVGATSPWLQIGGNSLRAIGLIGRIGQRFGIDISIREFFESGTVRALAARIAAACKPAREVIPLAPEQDSYPLTDAQAGLWILDCMAHARALYNNVEWLELHGTLDAAALQAAFGMLVERHESLRTAYFDAEGEPRQRILPTSDFTLQLESCTGDAQARVAEMLREERQRHFDLRNGRLLHVRLLRQAPQLHHLVINMHHIASDGWSMGVLIGELGTLYDAYRAGRENPLPPLRVQYADYAVWQRQWLRGEVLDGQLLYWRNRLEGLPLIHGLPLDHPRPARQGFEGGEHAQRQERGLRDRLEALGRQRGATLFMLLETAFSVLLSRYSRETDIVVGSPIAGRVHRDVEPLIGFFVNTLVLRTDLSESPCFSDLLESSRQTIQPSEPSITGAPCSRRCATAANFSSWVCLVAKRREIVSCPEASTLMQKRPEFMNYVFEIRDIIDTLQSSTRAGDE